MGSDGEDAVLVAASKSGDAAGSVGHERNRGLAQVATLPRAQDMFHVGSLLDDVTSVVTKVQREEEESYIPVALARTHLARVVQDMHTMKENHTAKLAVIVARYKAIENETKRYYEDYIVGLKAQAKAKVRVEQERSQMLEAEIEVKQQLAREDAQRLRDEQEQSQRQHAAERVQWAESVEARLSAYEEELTRFHGRVQHEIEAAVNAQAETLGLEHRAEVARARTDWEDARVESRRAIDEVKAIQARLQQSEIVYKTQIQRLVLDAGTDMETLKCLAHVVNRVVDMEEHGRRRKRSRELRGEIASLGHEVELSAERERSLATQLARMGAQYETLERQAVRQTMDVMLCTIQLLPAEPPSILQKLVVVSEPPPPTPSLCVESGAQTTDWETLLAANTPALPPVKNPVGTCDATVETMPESTLPKTVAESEDNSPVDLSAARLKFHADTERFKARNAELARSKQGLKALKGQLQTCTERKIDAKARVKLWLADFQQQHARDPTIEEKAQAKELYVAFKVSEEEYTASRDRVTTAKTQHQALVVEIEALSQWHALAASARSNSSRGGSGGTFVSRPGTSSATDASSVLLEVASTESAAARATELEREISILRSELLKAQMETKKADADAQQAMAEASRANADAQQHADRLAAAEVKIPDELSDRRDHVPIADKAESNPDRRREEETKHAQQMELYARESDALARHQSELQVSIAGLRGELAARSAEKQALETQIEQLRLHVELMDGADDSLLESDAKSTSRPRTAVKYAGDEDEHGGGGEEEEEKEVEQGGAIVLAPDDGDDSTAFLSSSAPLTETERADGVRESQLVAQIKQAIEAGKAQWNRGDKAKCFQIYVKMAENIIDVLRLPPPGRRDEVAAFKSALQEAGRLPPAKGSMVLRRQLDNYLTACEARARARDEKEGASTRASARESAGAPSKSSSTTPASSPQLKSPPKKSVAPSLSESFAADAKGSTTPTAIATTPLGGSWVKSLEEYKQKLKALETKAKADKVRITQLEAAVSKAETQLMNATANGAGGGGGGANAAVLERKLADAEKKHAKALDEAEKALKREMGAVAQQLSASQAKTLTLSDQVDKLSKELTVVGGRATQLDKMEEEVTVLRSKAAQVDGLSQDLALSKGELIKLEASYREEQALRKKYYNMIEDMKGKIRVYARCRPMSSSELERGCDASVRFVDEFSLELKTSHGLKAFTYDQVFTSASTQDQVFEDTKNLLQSAVDGYNVCIFAYGQTGSGKTFTMTGTESHPGLSPRVIHHLFRVAEESAANNVVTFQAFMLELYNDALIDLFHLVDGGSSHDANAPKLEIKKNERGMVFVSNITTKSCTSAQQTLKLFDSANKKRQVGATKMNAESSRSHSVFSILVENYNKTTKTTSIGKLSLVDLAGSERAGKTGATNDRLKEAQAINKSLSALGDVIAALSSGEKFIPYRNNKLTQLMQDSLGGNAKTLMFVNISPADYNQEETQTSLQYASRVKLITNNANKASESETVNRLKAVIKQLRAGKSDVELEGLGLD